MDKYKKGEHVEVRWPMLGGPCWIPAVVTGHKNGMVTCKVDRNGLVHEIDFRSYEIKHLNMFEIMGVENAVT